MPVDLKKIYFANRRKLIGMIISKIFTGKKKHVLRYNLTIVTKRVEDSIVMHIN